MLGFSLFGLFWVASSAFAVEPTPPPLWICSAQGQTIQGQESDVMGDFSQTENEAGESAMLACEGENLLGCRVTDCLQSGVSR